jgi:oligopeptide/dipeptide ABC transporter ATP-binding protein
VLTVGRQVGEPIEIHENPGRKTLRQRCADLLRRVRIPDAEHRIDSYPHQFSGGMRQRAMIAMSLACTPRLIIADEPTTALDVTVQAQVLELLKNVTRDSGSALILITHDLGVVARYAQRVNVMYAGRIVEQGPAREIYKNPKHPYTIGLMESVPRVDGDVNARLVPIEGQPPNLAARPKGCPFHPRCRYAQPQCREVDPPLTQVSGEHYKACWVDVNA